MRFTNLLSQFGITDTQFQVILGAVIVTTFLIGLVKKPKTTWVLVLAAGVTWLAATNMETVKEKFYSIAQADFQGK